MTQKQANKIKVGSIIEMRNAFQSFFYKVLEVPKDKNKRFKVLTEKGARFYLAEDFHSVSEEFDFSKVVIDKENIHLYYEFMSDKELLALPYFTRQFLNDVLYERGHKIYKDIKFDTQHLVNNFGSNTNKFLISKHYFGIKDTLKPIKEFIDEIKQSKEYLSYMEKKTGTYII